MSIPQLYLSLCTRHPLFVSVMRKIHKDITLSNGTCIPAGTIVPAAPPFEHMDPDHYSNPQDFYPWRFSDMREKDGEELRHQFVSTSVDYLPFGYGKYACPGRFFAANELKAMLAYVVMNYDVKFEHEGVRPQNVWFGVMISPDPTGRVMLKKRQD